MPVDLGGLPVDYIALNALLNKVSVSKNLIQKQNFKEK